MNLVRGVLAGAVGAAVRDLMQRFHSRRGEPAAPVVPRIQHEKLHSALAPYSPPVAAGSARAALSSSTGLLRDRKLALALLKEQQQLERVDSFVDVGEALSCVSFAVVSWFASLRSETACFCSSLPK